MSFICFHYADPNDVSLLTCAGSFCNTGRGDVLILLLGSVTSAGSVNTGRGDVFLLVGSVTSAGSVIQARVMS